MDIRKQEIVEECLEFLRQGRSLEECLERHPEEAAELEPILRVAVSVRGDLAAELPLAARTRISGRMLAEWDRQHQPRRPSSPRSGSTQPGHSGPLDQYRHIPGTGRHAAGAHVGIQPSRHRSGHR